MIFRATWHGSENEPPILTAQVYGSLYGGSRGILLGEHTMRIALLGEFRFLAGGTRLGLAEGSQRLLAFLALRGPTVRRMLIASTLWPDAMESRAYACLRSCLSRLHGKGRDAVAVDRADLGLASGVTVDFHEARALALRLLDSTTQPCDVDLSSAAISGLSVDLLPDWYEDWVVLEAEDWRQVRLHALESAARHLAASGRYSDAAMAALAAVRADPLRESAHEALIQIHLAEHNQSEAVREYGRYRDLLLAELGLEPTARLSELIATLLRP
jgi:DNA-binding SARP family transcriptional activator